MTRKLVTEEGRRRRRPTQSGVVLDRDLIVDTALKMLIEHGPDGLSARRLGRALGADPSSMYRYFRGVDDLILAVTEDLIGRATSTWRPTGDWFDDLYRWGLSAHAEYLRHPQAAMLAASRISARPAELAGIDLILGVLQDAGFSSRQTVYYYGAFITQMLAFAALDSSIQTMPTRARTADEARWASIYGAVSAETYPHIAAHKDLLVRMHGSGYSAALHLLLEGMRAELDA